MRPGAIRSCASLTIRTCGVKGGRCNQVASEMPAEEGKTAVPKRKSGGLDMAALVTHTPAADVPADFVASAAEWPLWDSDTHPHEPAGSGKFPFNYNGDYATERVLIVSGRATLAPDDGSEAVTLSAGDSVWFHHGFACQWTVAERMTKRYQYFGADGEVKARPNKNRKATSVRVIILAFRVAQTQISVYRVLRSRPRPPSRATSAASTASRSHSLDP